MEQLLIWLHTGYRLIAWGAWDGNRLAAQYCCRLTHVHLPGSSEPVMVGMSVNLAVHPNYRGRGLVKRVARPVYDQVMEQGGIAGVGFSNAQGVQVDLKSRSYGYQVIGRMQPMVIGLSHWRYPPPLTLTDEWQFDLPDLHCSPDDYLRLAITADSLRHRFACHPFRRYRFGVWNEPHGTRGLVVYRDIRIGGLKGVALLAVYAEDVPALLARWAGAVRQQGAHFVHVLLSPHSLLQTHLRQIGLIVQLPYSRSPYYLTAKSFDAVTPAALLDIGRWDCIGGDIL